jgi:hypothetical protein
VSLTSSVGAIIASMSWAPLPPAKSPSASTTSVGQVIRSARDSIE